MESIQIESDFELYNGSKVFFSTPDDKYSYFYGYYDKNPLNNDNTKLLCHRVDFDGREVCHGDYADIGFFDLVNNVYIKLDETLAWNWQQGSQLQWLPGSNYEKIIYNVIIDDNYCSVILNMSTLKKDIIEFPIYVINPDGKKALAINYKRHYWCRPGYNYQNIQDNEWNTPYREDDGVYKIDLTTGDVELIISISDIIKIDFLKEFETENSWLEHMMYNPSGTRFMFFHRWNHEGKDYTRLYTADSETGEKLHKFNDSRFYSHAHWENDDMLTIWTREPVQATSSKLKKVTKVLKHNNLIKKILKPIYRLFIRPLISEKSKESISPATKLLNIDDKYSNTNQERNYEMIGGELLFGNGHITWSRNNNYLLNDTYQDEFGYRHLMIYDRRKNNVIDIGRFYSYYNDSTYRADLHPRFSADEKYIIIDCALTSKREMIILKPSLDVTK